MRAATDEGFTHRAGVGDVRFSKATSLTGATMSAWGAEADIFYLFYAVCDWCDLSSLTRTSALSLIIDDRQRR